MLTRWMARFAGVGLVAGGLLAIPGSPALGVTDSYSCTSSAGGSTTTYTVTGDVAATVAQGSSFQVTNIVVTGTPDVELWLEDIQFTFANSAGATATGSLTNSFVGPAGTEPPGPPAPAGVPNSSPAMTLDFGADGAVGTVVDFYLVDVSATAVEIGAEDDPMKLDVSCSNSESEPFASTEIVAPQETTTTTAAPTTTTTTCEYGDGDCGTTTTTDTPITTLGEPTTTVPGTNTAGGGGGTNTTAAAGGTLPRTGNGSGPMTFAALASVVAGLALLALSRPRLALARKETRG